MLLRLLAIACLSACSTTGQMPDPPNQARVEPFQIEANGVVVAGEVHSLSRHPQSALIIVGGSGSRTREDTAAAVQIFLDEETAVVLMDRRGNGLSTGAFEVPDTANTEWQVPRFGADVAAAADHLKQAGFQRVVLLGTSLGGWVNASASVQAGADIDAVVSMSGGGSSVGVSDEFDRLTDEGMTLAQVTEQARTYTTVTGYDPLPDLERMQQPTLWVFGELDDSNPTALDLENVKRLATSGRPFTWLVVPGAGHEFTDAVTGEFNGSWIEPVRRFVHGD